MIFINIQLYPSQILKQHLHRMLIYAVKLQTVGTMAVEMLVDRVMKIDHFCNVIIQTNALTNKVITVVRKRSN